MGGEKVRGSEGGRQKESGPRTAGECVKAGDDRCFCQRSNSRRFVGAAQMPPPPPSMPLDRLWCEDNKTEAVLSAVKWPHWHSTTCGQGKGESDGEVQVWAQGLKGLSSGGGGVINVGVSVRGQGKGSLTGLWEPAETWGPWRSCLWGKQMFSLGGVPSLQSNLQLLGGQVFNKGAECGTFRRQMLQLWYNNILIMTVDHRAEGCSGTSHPTGLEPPSGWH